MITIHTPIGPGVLVGRLTGGKLLVMYSKRVLEQAVAAGYEEVHAVLRRTNGAVCVG